MQTIHHAHDEEILMLYCVTLCMVVFICNIGKKTMGGMPHTQSLAHVFKRVTVKV